MPDQIHELDQGASSASLPTALSSSGSSPVPGLAPDGLQSTGASECHGLDTPERVCFYEQDFYVLSNFSSFAVEWSGFLFPTSEHLYHWLRFIYSEEPGAEQIARRIVKARSAHDAFKLAQEWKHIQHPDWPTAKVRQMKRVLFAKVEQHEYVYRKLLATGDRELVENSWRDDFWGWGPNRDGQNMLGKLWMEIRAELRPASVDTHPQGGDAVAAPFMSGAVPEGQTPNSSRMNP